MLANQIHIYVEISAKTSLSRVRRWYFRKKIIFTWMFDYLLARLFLMEGGIKACKALSVIGIIHLVYATNRLSFGLLYVEWHDMEMEEVVKLFELPIELMFIQKHAFKRTYLFPVLQLLPVQYDNAVKLYIFVTFLIMFNHYHTFVSQVTAVY